MLRWRSDDALKIYARINDDKYADEVEKAANATVSSVRTTTTTSSAMLREMAACAGGAVAASREAGFQEYVLASHRRLHHGGGDAPARGHPLRRRLCARVQQMQTALSALTVRADQHDIEDREVLQRARVGHV